MNAVLLPRFTTTLRPLILAGVLLIVSGSLLVGQGLYIRAKALLAQVLLERAWSETLATGKPVKAWSWADTHPVARISFPRLGQSEIVLQEAGGEALAFGPAHVAGSPQPGARGMSVIGGHRDTHFLFLKDVKVGDSVDVETASGQVVHYRVTGSSIVPPQSSGIATGGQSRRLALVTCYPFDALGHAPLRYVVFAQER